MKLINEMKVETEVRTGIILNIAIVEIANKKYKRILTEVDNIVTQVKWYAGINDKDLLFENNFVSDLEEQFQKEIREETI